LAEAIVIAGHAGLAAQARLSYLQAAFAYVLDKPEQAAQAIRVALDRIESLRARGDTAAPDLGAPASLVSFTAEYMRGVLAAASGKWLDLFESIRMLNRYKTVMQLPTYANATALLEIDALLRRNADGDTENAVQLLQMVQASVPQSLFGWSDSAQLARARIAARRHDANVRGALRAALDAVEEQAHRMPLDCYRAFERLAEAADEACETGIRDRALARSVYYLSMRMAAAPAPGLAYTR
jgi:hypothetical protein